MVPHQVLDVSFVSTVAADKCADSESIVLDTEAVLKLQTADEDISMMLTYLTSGDLPADKKRAQTGAREQAVQCRGRSLVQGGSHVSWSALHCCSSHSESCSHGGSPPGSFCWTPFPKEGL